MRSLVMSECSLSGRGHGHVSNFYIVDLDNFATASRRYTGAWYTQLDRLRFVYDTYRTMRATRSRHGCVQIFIAHRRTVTLQLHNFDLFRTSGTSSFCTVAWQMARFQLTQRIARYLCDSWGSCVYILFAILLGKIITNVVWNGGLLQFWNFLRASDLRYCG